MHRSCRYSSTLSCGTEMNHSHFSEDSGAEIQNVWIYISSTGTTLLSPSLDL